MILVYDSGLGGISSLNNLVRKYPRQQFLMFGDRRNAPYGNRDAETLQNLFEKNVSYFEKEGIQDVIVQCNTLCSLLKFDEYSLCIHDIITKTLEKCDKLSRESSVLVVGTNLTVRAGRYQSGLKKKGFHKVTALPLKELAGMIENFVSEREIQHYLEKEIGDRRYDYVILGCTHFPFYRSLFEKITGGICIDSTDLDYDFSSPAGEGGLVLALQENGKLKEFLQKYLQVPFRWYGECELF